MILLCLCICGSSSGQVNRRCSLSVHTEPLTYLKRGAATIGFDYAFDEKWSVEGSASLQLVKEKKSHEEQREHDMNLSGHEGPALNVSTYPLNIYIMGICYWPRRHLDGTYMKLCCSCDSGDGVDLVLGAGYAIPIWKGCGVSIGYEIGVVSIARNDIYAERDLNIKLFYRF